MSVKIERLNDQFQKEISIILQTEVKDQDIKFVTITGCEITNDLSFCKVYFTVLDDTKRESTLEALKASLAPNFIPLSKFEYALELTKGTPSPEFL